MLFMQEEVQAGMALLDEKRPGWDAQVDLPTLNLQSPLNCILGQAFSTYSEGLWYLGLDRDSVADHGFVVRADSPQEALVNYILLTGTWIIEIVARRVASRTEQEREVVMA